MKHSANENTFQTNILQALQKNKNIQDKLAESQRLNYVQLVRDMQFYHVQEKYNRELLYKWKKETYVRKLKKNLQEYQRKRFGVRDAYYEYQVRNIDNIIAGQQGLVIPPIEEARRSTVNAKYRQFLQNNPLQSPTKPSPIRHTKSAIVTNTDNKVDENEENVDIEIEETWKHIHARSAVGPKRKQKNLLPSLQRSSTMDEIRRNKALAKHLQPPTVAIVSNVLVTTSPELVNPPANQKSPVQPTKQESDLMGLPAGVEPILITSEVLEKHTRSDLISMRSVRRPRKEASDLNLIFETRKRICHINKRALDHRLCQRKCGLQQNPHFDQPKPIETSTHVDNSTTATSISNENKVHDKHQSEKIVI